MIENVKQLHAMLDRVQDLLATKYNVKHATIQCEPKDHVDHDTPI